MNLLGQFVQEYNELYYKNLSKESKGDVLQEIKQAEKAINNPKLHPTQELKHFYRSLREHYKMPLRVMFIGNCHLSQVSFMNILFRNPLIPLHNGLSQKKIIIRLSPNFFTKIHYKNGSTHVSLNVLNCHANNLDEIEYFEIFAPMDVAHNVEIIKDSDKFDKKPLSALKEVDLLVWIIDKTSKVTQDFTKITKKKPTIAILIHDDKASKEQALEQISIQKRYFDENFSLEAIYDINLQELGQEYRLDEKFAIYKILGTLQGQTLFSKVKSIESISASLMTTKCLIESFYAKKTTSSPQAQSTVIKDFSNSIHAILHDAKIRRGHLLLRDALEKNKVIDQHYKILFKHYKMLDYTYHKAHKNLINKVGRLITEYNHEIFGTISKGLKRYFESIVDGVLENIEFMKIKTRPSKPGILDIITNRRIVYEGFRFNQVEFFEEIESAQGLLTRRFKSLTTRIGRFDSYIERYIQEIEQSFDDEIGEWVARGHRLVLQKKPTYVSMESYLSLEEFNLSVYQNLTRKHVAILRKLKDSMHSNLNALSVWVQATKTLILECIIGRLDQKFHADKLCAKKADFASLTPLNRKFIVDTILDTLPTGIQEVFCKLPYCDSEFNYIPDLLEKEMRENEKNIRDRVREMIGLRQTLKVSTKILEESISGYQNKQN